MLTTRSVAVSVLLCTTAYLQVERWKHARLIQTLLKYDTIGYQIPGGLFVAPNEGRLDASQRVFIDLKCQCYKQDEPLSQFRLDPYWFSVEYPRTRTETPP